MPTHGSLTKAGKVRNQTPKIVATVKTGSSPRRRNLRKFKKMIKDTQSYGGRGRRRRRRR